MVLKLKNVFYKCFLLFFVFGYIHFVSATVLQLNVDSLGALICLLINSIIIFIINKNLILKKEGVIKYLPFIFLFIILIIYGNLVISLNYAILYNIYILIELFLLLYIFSHINFKDFKIILLQFRNAYLIVNIPLFILYLIDILNIYNFPNRFIVFDGYRFGGFVSEPRGLAIFTLLSLLTILLAKRKNNLYQRLEIIFYFVVLFTTYSNSIFLFFLLYSILLYFFRLRNIIKLLYIFLIIILMYMLWNLIPNFLIGRLTFDKESLIYIFSHLSDIKDIDVSGVNALNIRLWIFLKGIFDIHWWGLGFESATNFSKLQGLPQSDAIGIVTIFTDFGWIIGSIIVFYMMYVINKIKMIDFNSFKLLVGLFVLLFMSPPYAKFYLIFYVYYMFLFSKFKKEKMLCCHQ